MKKFLFVLLLFVPYIMFGQQIYFGANAGFNSLGFVGGGHDFTTTFEFGVQVDSAWRVSSEFGYNPSSAILEDIHTAKNELVKSSGNFSFGPEFAWSPFGTFLNDRDWRWFDLYLNAGTGMDFYRSDALHKFYGGYIKFGLEFDFNIRNITFLLKADAREKMAASYKDSPNGMSPNYWQQNILVGFKYFINLPPRKDNITNINNYITNNIPQHELNTTQVLIVHDTVVTSTTETVTKEVKVEVPVYVEVHDTIIQVVHDTIEKEIEVSNLTSQNVLFANDKYDIRNTELYKLNLVLETLRKYPQLKLELIGMANKTGSASHNKWLSERRCESVKNWFIMNGIGSEKITEIPMGDGQSDGEGVDRCVVIKYVK